MKTIDEFFEEIKDLPDAYYQIDYLALLWSEDYKIINNMLVISGKEPIKKTYVEYMEGVDGEIDELRRRLKEYNELKKEQI